MLNLFFGPLIQSSAVPLPFTSERIGMPNVQETNLKNSRKRCDWPRRKADASTGWLEAYYTNERGKIDQETLRGISMPRPVTVSRPGVDPRRTCRRAIGSMRAS